MARLWHTGFELNSTTTDVEFSNVTGTVSLQSTTVLAGTYAARTNPSATTAFIRYHVYTSDQSTVAYQRVWLRVASLPAANTTIMRFANTANNQCAQLRLTTTGTLVLLDAGSTPVGSASAALSLNTWYLVELGLDASANPGTVTARLNEVQFASGANNAQSPWARVIIGVIVGTTTDLYWDSWAVNDNSGSNQNSWPGTGQIIHLLPNADGDSHQWSDTANSAGTSNNYTLVDEVPPNDTTDLVQTGTLNNTDMYNLTASGLGANDVVNCVAGFVRLRNNTADATAAAKFQVEKTSGGTIAQGSAIVPNTTTFFSNASAQPRNFTYIAYADPDGNPWTQSTLDTAQAGVKLTTAGTNRIQVTHVSLSVDYTPRTLVTPSAVACSASVPAPTVDTGTANATPTPDAVACTAATPAPTLSTGSTPTPSAVAGTCATPAPTLSAGSTLLPGAVAGVAATPAMSFRADATPAPSAVAGTAQAPAATLSAGATLLPSAVSAVAATPAVTFYADATPAPATVAGAASLPSPALSTGSTLSPGAVTGQASQPAISFVADATPAPATVSAVGAVASPALSAGWTVSASTTAATTSLPAPTPSAGSTQLATSVSAICAVAGVALSTGVTSSPAVVSAVAALPAPAIQVGGSVTVSPSGVACTAAVLAPDLSTGATLTAGAVAAVASAPAPGLSAGAAPTPGAVAGTAAVLSVTLSAGSTLSVGVLAATAGVASPALSTGSTATPAVAGAVCAQPAAAVTTSSVVTPGVVAAAVSIPTPGAGNLSALAQDLAVLLTVTGRLAMLVSTSGRQTCAASVTGRISAEV